MAPFPPRIATQAQGAQNTGKPENKKETPPARPGAGPLEPPKNRPVASKLRLVLQDGSQPHAGRFDFGKVGLTAFFHVRVRTHWRDGLWVYIRVALRVVFLDVREVGGFLESRHVPVQVLHPVVEDRIVVSDGSQVRLEMLMIHSLRKAVSTRPSSQRT